MPILKGVLDSLDSIADKMCAVDMSHPRYNLTALGVHHKFESDSHPAFIVRDAEAQETKLVAPGTKGVYEDMLARMGVQHANLGIEQEKELDSRAFEDFYDKTVDLADLCQLPDVNERLNNIANQYQEYNILKEDLAVEAKKYAAIPRIRQRVARRPQMEKEIDELKSQLNEMEAETDRAISQTEAMDGEISYLRMENEMNRDSSEQAAEQLKEKRHELEALKLELENKKRFLASRRDAYQKKRPLTAVEHAERMRSALEAAILASQEDSKDNHPIRDAYIEKLSEIIDNSDSIGVTNNLLDNIFANIIDRVANEDVESLEARRASRRLSATTTTPSGRVLSAQLLCILYSNSADGAVGMPEDDLRSQITEFALERQWNPELAVQAMYEIFGKKLAKRYREGRTHMVRLLWN